MMVGGRYPQWGKGWRDQAWSVAHEPWDVLVIGGGITGAGLLNEAARRGWRALLVEGGDFASGTSSRSGKLVHGGMRYLRRGKVGLTRTLLTERDRLLRELPGLVDPLDFVLPTFRGRTRDRLGYALGVRLYDILRGCSKSWHRYDAEAVMARVPGVLREGLDGGYGYTDAVTDDARLVLRTIREATLHGATAVNYVRAESLVREGGRVTGAELVDQEDRRRVTVRARVVFNTTGAESDQLRQGARGARRLRRIRGTHLVFPRHALPITQAVSFRHPKNARYIYMLPWEGATLVGTTDVDDGGERGREPHATEAEVTYLLEALTTWLPGLRLGRDDLLATFAGVRPVMDTGAADPYRESRDSVLWEEDGLVTVVSGKLTGFQPIVERAVDSALGPVPGGGARPALDRSFASGDVEALSHLKDGVNTRLLGRYGADASYLVAAAGPGELESVEDTPALWGELRWGARAEGVVHLDDLLLRRTRVGLVLRHGGSDIFSRVRDICREELGWETQRWSEEEERYRRLWQEAYRVPGEV